MTIEIKPGDLHVWHANIGPQYPSVDFIQKFLSEDERDRAARFRFDVHRRRYIFSHACLRLLLGSYLQVAPETISFGQGPYGKPYLATADKQLGSATDRVLDFNISHSADLAVLGFTLNASVGIDTEFINPKLDVEEIAPTVFTAAELTFLYSVPPPVRSQKFFDLWSRKEAYAKALGMGLQLPFKEIEIGQQSLVNGLRIQSFEPAPGYAAAVAAPPSVYSIQYFEFNSNFWIY